MINTAIMKKYVCRFGIASMLLGIGTLFSCAQEEKVPNAFFIEHFYQAAKSDDQYILENYDRAETLDASDLELIMGLTDSKEFKQAGINFHARTLVVDRMRNRSIRIGSTRGCRFLIILSSDSTRCDEVLYNQLWTILEKYDHDGGS